MTAPDHADSAEHPEDLTYRDLKPGKTRGSKANHVARNPYLRRSLTPKVLDDNLKWSQILYADWLANNPGRVTWKDKRQILSQLARVPYDNIALSFVKALEARDDFKLLVRKFEEDAIASARAKLEGGAPIAAEVAVKGVNHLNERLDAVDEDGKSAVTVEDLKLVPTLTAPFIERAWPKKQETGGAAAVIQINLSPAQDNVLDTPAYHVEGEEITEAIIEDGDGTSNP